ncbi:HAMP domain-containing histidine kinase [Tissierella pigra]|uniref:histidine kinase n=1 Tax=Tissierella pigra TaxID=2607614 RepID=A0A6N7XKZ5_9FIRM|nr:HAMP domain-containing sensor histidine kinase [Tissierella pigra]MBU5427760.1 HAMP domain-containing histidine kinase [Tissierella pigra]MSU02709.1 HAMP domain-containing histidine kinase [Tissierella pigra]
MGLKKEKELRSIFIKYILSLGFFIIILLMINYYLIFIVSFGVYPANYSEKIIQKNLDKLKESPKVTMDLLTPMCSFGVYSNDGDYLYGNFSKVDQDLIWDNYNNNKMSSGIMKYIASIKREDGILLIKYPLTLQYKNEKLRSVLPNGEITTIIVFIIEFIIVLLLVSNRFAKKINKELKLLLSATKKIEEQNLEFDIENSNLREINMVLQGIHKMKSSLKVALEEQWAIEQQKRAQISALAHDVKTPLTIVRGNIGLLVETDITEEQKSYCNYIEESSKQMEEYIQRLLAIARNQTENNIQNENIYVVKMLKHLKSQGDALGKTKNIKIILEIDIEEDVYIKGNRNELERGIMNIIVNAVDFSPKNSTVKVNGFIDNFYLTIEVIDQGKGFSPKMLRYGKEQLIMGDESRTKSGHHGLGLYIADTIIKKYNGELILSNDVNGGGIVKIKILL